MPSPTRPRPFTVGPVRARATRGPRGEGEWYWRAVRYAGGVEIPVWVGWATRAAALEEVARQVADAGGQAPAPRPVEREGDDEADTCDTIKDLMELWSGAVKVDAGIAWRTRDAYIRRAKIIRRLAGDVRTDRVDERALATLRNALLRTYSSRTAFDAVQKLRQAWHWGRARGLVEGDLPVVRIRVTEAREKPTPSHAEIARVLDALDGWPRLVLLVLAATGARVGEVAVLAWKDVDGARGEVTLRGKTGLRVAPLAAEAAAELRAALPHHPEGRLWPVAADTVRTTFTTWALGPACDRAGVRRFTPHGVRRYAIDRAVDAGVDVAIAARWFGHSPEVMLRFYRRPTMDQVHKAAEKARIGIFSPGTVLPFRRAAGGGGEPGPAQPGPAQPEDPE